MTSCIANTTGMYEPIPSRLSVVAPMRLRIIFNEFQVIFLAQLCNLIRHCAAAIEMHDTNSLRPRCDTLLNQLVINFQRLLTRFYQHRLQTILRDTQNRRYIRICRNDNFVTRLHHAQLDIRAENPDESI